ncbi:MAG: tRNA pseudouridine(55) synthase TruB [Patescibacteria group bacterium]
MSFLFLNKPAGWTSHDVVNVVRRVTGERRVGHAGTLDPFATGLLIVAVGRESTRMIDTFKAHEKEYEVVAQFGATSDTQDRMGVITPTPGTPVTVTREMLQATLPEFTGHILQIPPMYSAKKINGHKLYELARAGKTVERQPSAITIYHIEILDCKENQATLRVVCSVGTYIRTLVHDIGQRIGCGAYAAELTRTRIGVHTLAQAQDVEVFRATVTPKNESSAPHPKM